jgi:hypothetical protein
MSQTLSDYNTEVRRLLHDANANFYTNSELTDNINAARLRLVRDTGCLRELQSYTLLQGAETFNYSDLPKSTRTLDILNINVYWGNSRVPLRYLAWTDFNAQLRYWQNYQGLPIGFSIYGANKVFIGPVPDQNYTADVDTVIMPLDLVNLSDVDEIPAPYTSPVQFYAAYIAKYKEQSYGEAEIFKQEYLKNAQSVLNSVFTRRMPTPYSQAY